MPDPSSKSSMGSKCCLTLWHKQLFCQWSRPSFQENNYNTGVNISCVFVFSADVHISVVFGSEELWAVAALVAAWIMERLNVIHHSVPPRGCLSTKEALVLNQTHRSFNLLNNLIHPGQVA